MKVLKLDKKNVFLYLLFKCLTRRSVFTKMVIGVIALNVTNVLKIERYGFNAI